MLNVVQELSQETLDFRLQAVFELAEEARNEAVFDIANQACAYLLAYALDEDPYEKSIRIDIATTDLYGEARSDSKYDIAILRHLSGRTTRIPMHMLKRDALATCFRRRGGEFQRRSHPGRYRGVPVFPTEETRSYLRQKFTHLVGEDGIARVRSVLAKI